MRRIVHPMHIARQAVLCIPCRLQTDFAVHHVHMTNKLVKTRLKGPRYRPTFIRQWREHREMTLEQLGEAIHMSHAQLGRIERGLQPYNQAMLEALAVELQTDVASLLMRDPSDPDAMWSLWDQAKPGERQMIVNIARGVLKTGS